jgi:flavin reductase (DIM6/NTAB) family NADH-FMN oxidoreductase RutF
VDKINETAASLPPDQSEIELAGLTAVNSEIINVPGIREAKVRMECVLEHSALLGGNADFLIGRVLQFHIDDQIYHDGRIDPRGLAAVSRLAGNSYAKIGEIFDLARPK